MNNEEMDDQNQQVSRQNYNYDEFNHQNHKNISNDDTLDAIVY